MNDYIIRPWREEDKPDLKTLWKLAFGDSDDYIDTFFRNFLKKDGCVVAEWDGRVVSAMYILSSNRLNPYRKNILTAGYTYALATRPEYRGRGIGAAVYKAAAEKALETHDMACVLPAEEGLYPFYEKANGAKVVSCLREARFTREEVTARRAISCARIPAFQYFGIREMHMNGLPHVTYSEAFMDFMEEYGEENMDFFLSEQGIAAVETANGVCRVTELLCPDTDGMDLLAGIAAYHRAEEYIVRSPFFFDGPGTKKAGVMAVMKGEPDYPMPFDLWWGFGLD